MLWRYQWHRPFPAIVVRIAAAAIGPRPILALVESPSRTSLARAETGQRIVARASFARQAVGHFLKQYSVSPVRTNAFPSLTAIVERDAAFTPGVFRSAWCRTLNSSALSTHTCARSFMQ